MKFMKKLTAVFMAGVMTVTALSGSFTGFAAETDNGKVSAARVWNGKADTSWFTKNKKKDTYNISTAEQLAGFAQLVEEAAHEDRFQGVTINLTSDIVLNDTSNWENWREVPPKNVWNPIGKVGSPVNGYCPFAGVFNGNGHTISGMYVNEKTPSGLFASPKPAGLFAYISGAIVCNLRIEKSVVIGEGSVGGLTALSENSYIDSVEVSNIKVYGVSGTPVGGIVGEAGRVNMTTMMFHMTLLAFGVLANPLIFNDGQGVIRASYLNNCKAIDTDIYTNAWSPSGGGLVGQIFRGGIHNSLSVNCTLHSMCNYRRDWASYGAILGSEEYQGECELKNSYCYGYSVDEKDKERAKKLKRSDEERVKAVSQKKLYSKDLAKKLGKAFVSVSNGSPRLKTVDYPKVQVTLSGSKAKLSWKSVKNAKIYYVFVWNDEKQDWDTAGTSEKASVTLKDIKKGNEYKLWIRAYLEDGSKEELVGGAFTLKA